MVGIEADNQHILLAMDAGVYNVHKATCGPPPCYTCDGTTTYWVAASPFGVAVNGQTQENLMAQWDTGAQYDYTNTSGTTWNSSDTTIATVQTGMVKGVGGGSVTINGGTTGEPVYTQVCGLYAPSCPIAGGGGGSAPGNVQVPTALRVVQTTYNGPPNTPACPSGYSGWKRVATRAVVDQIGRDIKVGNQLVSETVTPNAGEDGLYMTGHIVTGTGDTDDNGQYPDTFSVCSPACPGSATTTATQTNSDQMPSGGSYPLTNSTITYACTYIKINGALTP